MKRKIVYKFKRKNHYEVKNGFYLEDVKTKKVTGFIIDEEIGALLDGKPIKRMIDECDGNHGFDTSSFRRNKIYKRPEMGQEKGRIKDIEMNQYPFDNGQLIRIQLTKRKEIFKR